MNIKVGDKVKFLNDSGGGTVSRVIKENMVHVLIEDGFEIPVLVSELIKVGNAGENEGGSDRSEYGEAAGKQILLQDINYDKIPKELNFIIMDANRSGMFDTWFVNAIGYDIPFSIYSLQENDYVLLKTGMVKNMEKQFLVSLKEDTFIDISKFVFQFLLVKNKAKLLIAPVEKELAVNWPKLKKGEYYKENAFFKQKAASFPVIGFPDVDKADLSEAKELRRAFNQKIREGVRQEARTTIAQEPRKGVEIEEVDLHIDLLVDNYQALTKKEILDIQMGRFITALEGGILNNVRRMVFIHGLGNGKLKYEIGKELDRKYPKLKYQDASFKEYGYGATLVILK